jgi:hypothetical protein
MSLLLPQHTKLKEQISEVLDADIIRQQAEKGILDFQVSDETPFFISNCHSSIFSVFLSFLLSPSSASTVCFLWAKRWEVSSLFYLTFLISCEWFPLLLM